MKRVLHLVEKRKNSGNWIFYRGMPKFAAQDAHIHLNQMPKMPTMLPFFEHRGQKTEKTFAEKTFLFLISPLYPLMHSMKMLVDRFFNNNKKMTELTWSKSDSAANRRRTPARPAGAPIPTRPWIRRVPG